VALAVHSSGACASCNRRSRRPRCDSLDGFSDAPPRVRCWQVSSSKMDSYNPWATSKTAAGRSGKGCSVLQTSPPQVRSCAHCTALSARGPRRRHTPTYLTISETPLRLRKSRQVGALTARACCRMDGTAEHRGVISWHPPRAADDNTQWTRHRLHAAHHQLATSRIRPTAAGSGPLKASSGPSAPSTN